MINNFHPKWMHTFKYEAWEKIIRARVFQISTSQNEEFILDVIYFSHVLFNLSFEPGHWNINDRHGLIFHDPIDP